LLAALLVVAAVSLATTVAVLSSRTQMQRQREDDLLFVGGQYRAALRSYNAIAPAKGARQYPTSLEDLLLDRRFPNTVRHLRKLYVDPLTGQFDWIVERANGQIVGIHPPSEAAPLRRANFPDPLDQPFSEAGKYSEWRFVAAVAAAAGGPPVGLPAGGIPDPVEAPPPAPPAAPPMNPIEAAIANCLAQFTSPAVTGQCDALKATAPQSVRSCLYDLQRQYEACVRNAGG